MPDFSDLLDSMRYRRGRELSDLKSLALNASSDPFNIRSKAVILFAYAHWEGFYNECVEALLNRLQELGVSASHASWLLLVGTFEGEFATLSDRNHSYEAKCDFLDAVKARMSADFSSFNKGCVMARSNLNFSKLSLNFRILSFDVTPFQTYRNRLDRELVAWRHSVAHGGSPELESFAVERHLELASNLLLQLSQTFQSKMLSLEQA